MVHKAVGEDNKQTHYEGLIALISGEAEKTAINLNNIPNPPSSQQLSIIETGNKCIIILDSGLFSTIVKFVFIEMFLVLENKKFAKQPFFIIVEYTIVYVKFFEL